MTGGRATGAMQARASRAGQQVHLRGQQVHLRGRLSQFASTNRQNTTNMMMTTVWVSMVVS